METGRDMSDYCGLRRRMIRASSQWSAGVRATCPLEEWRSSVDWVTVVWQTKGRLLDALMHWLLLYRCTEVSNGQKPLRMKGKRAWQLLERTVSFSGSIAAYPLLA